MARGGRKKQRDGDGRQEVVKCEAALGFTVLFVFSKWYLEVVLDTLQ